MRHLIPGMVAAVAVMAASPTMACGYSSCSPCATGYVSACAQTYVAPVASYGYGYGCNTGCGWATERLPDPVQQYSTSTRARPIPVPATGPRCRPTRKAGSIAMVATAPIATAARCAATTDLKTIQEVGACSLHASGRCSLIRVRSVIRRPRATTLPLSLEARAPRASKDDGPAPVVAV
jgi:hypothetical protein